MVHDLGDVGAQPDHRSRLPYGFQCFHDLPGLAVLPEPVGAAAMVVDGDGLLGGGLPQVAPEIAILGSGLRHPLDAPAFLPVFVQQSHDVPVGARLK